MTCRNRPRHRGLALGLLVVCGFTAMAAAPAPATVRDRALQQRLNALLAAPEFSQGFFGVYVFSLDRQRVVFNHNGDHYFTPASNAKLFTLATALHRLGPDFRFHTAVQTTSAPDAQGVIAGDIALVGDGDPSLSGRPYPYRVDPAEPQWPYDAELVPRELAQRLAARGVAHIRGNVIGDDSYFAPDPYPAGWAISDELWDYGAPVSALTLNDNTRWLRITPGATPGDAVQLRWMPTLNPPAIDNHATTGTASHLRLQQDPVTGTLVLSGTIAATSPGVLEALAVTDPALYAAQLLRAALIAQGIAVDGPAAARHVPLQSTTQLFQLADWVSPPLEQILQATAKVSQNLEAEITLRDLGKLEGQPGGQVVRGFLHSAGLNARDTALVDGSGLARQDLVTPAGIVRLLRYMAGAPQSAVWRSLLPIAATDGTLQHRFINTLAAGQLEAKTGSLSHVNSLSGYVTSRHGEHFAFSLLSNNVNRPANQVRTQLDKLAEAVAEW